MKIDTVTIPAITSIITAEGMLNLRTSAICTKQDFTRIAVIFNSLHVTLTNKKNWSTYKEAG